jgi:hypothetical protein
MHLSRLVGITWPGALKQQHMHGTHDACLDSHSIMRCHETQLHRDGDRLDLGALLAFGALQGTGAQDSWPVGAEIEGPSAGDAPRMLTVFRDPVHARHDCTHPELRTRCHPCNFRQLQWPMPSSSSIYCHPIPAQLHNPTRLHCKQVSRPQATAKQQNHWSNTRTQSSNHVQGRDHHPVARLPAPRRAAVAVPHCRSAGRLPALRKEWRRHGAGGARGGVRRGHRQRRRLDGAEAVRGAAGAPHPPGVPGAAPASGGGVRLPGRVRPHRAPLRRGPLPRRPPPRVLGLLVLLRPGRHAARARRRAAAAAGDGRREARLVMHRPTASWRFV